ncbi:Fpg/Nei family DNA glycosylase [Ruficoccus amylovorans]|uniref:Fpg/Nei family DNA glycosylase n=1 Tax=Ruficoccus amylovorans TaxID=1804625 RepID=A0A842HJW3_9BACT|nr:DNA-formamidopyrimidine glycosylase family protein [Ruficoccus amylovorans]MBC2595777.1 Fpg/Nei family DNA glycosylase [Ruficoccus amylovorans]
MPELAEVEFYRKQWNPGLGESVREVRLHPQARIFRECDTGALDKALRGAVLERSWAHGKQMLFGFGGGGWLGVHLGMTGKLFSSPVPYVPDRHDHLVLVQAGRVLVFNDPRLFGRVRFETGAEPPPWWRELPPQVLSEDFTLSLMRAFLQRRKRSPLKAVLLMQECFPGIGNWMADEILWRAALHPATPAGSLDARTQSRLYRTVREVCADAMEVIGTDWGDPPPDWLFPHRWEDGGTCPKTGQPLVRETIGGRTTCYSPARQVLPPAPPA